MASSSSSSSEKTAEPASVKYLVLALGLLVGFVIGFVMLLASLPVDDALVSYTAREAQTRITGNSENSGKAEYKFYEILPQKVVPAASRRDPGTAEVVDTANVVSASVEKPATTKVVVPAPGNRVITPATRVVPANAQNLGHGYTEVPANYKSLSYYLQAGKYQTPEQAHEMRARILLLGLQPFIVTREEPGGKIRHRVRVGPYQDPDLLTEAKRRLHRGNIHYEVVKVTRG